MRRVKVWFAVAVAVLVAAGCTSRSPAPLATDRVAMGETTVVLRHPSEWRRQLSPDNRHYSETTAFFANFDLRPACGPTVGGQGVACRDDLMGVFPGDGVMVSVGWFSGGPGLVTVDQLVAHGTPTTIGGRRAAEVDNQLKTCSGTGATHSARYMIDDGASDVALVVVFCWRGESPTVAAQVRNTAATLAVER